MTLFPDSTVALHWAVCCFHAAIYSRLSIEDRGSSAALLILSDWMRWRARSALVLPDLSALGWTRRCLESHIDQLIRWIPSITGLALNFQLCICEMTSRLHLKPPRSVVMSCYFSARPGVSLCNSLPAAPFHNKQAGTQSAATHYSEDPPVHPPPLQCYQ